MADYSQHKVPELKKLLQDRGLIISGNKADLIARLQEDDKKSGGGGTGEDEIDWDEDDNKATTAPAATAIAAGGQGQVVNPVAVPNQTLGEDPVKTTDLKVAGGEEGAQTVADGAGASSGEATKEATSVPEAPKVDYSIGIEQTNAEKEAERRAARAKRFGITEDDEAKKLAERAKKFGLDSTQAVLKELDSALPERRAKRTREDKQGGRNAKRQTPDRRTEASTKVQATAVPAKKPLGRITDDPTEKAKAEARAKRFQAAA